MRRITEESSPYRHLEKMTTEELLTHINAEDQKVPLIIKEIIPQIIPLVDLIASKLAEGGRLFYIGAGTSGRLGILDASECPPTFGVPQGMVIGLMAGGDAAIRKAVEFAEDDESQAWKDIREHAIDAQDVLIGIAASGTTPYVLGGLRDAQAHGITTGCITCNPDAPIIAYGDYPVVAVVGPEFVTGSTRLKAGTAQKLILNMISTAVMIRLGRILDNKMVDMQLANNKLLDRGTRMIIERYPTLSYENARELLLKYGSVRGVLKSF